MKRFGVLAVGLLVAACAAGPVASPSVVQSSAPSLQPTPTPTTMTATPIPTPAPTPSPSPTVAPTVVSGKGGATSKPIKLAGNFAVTWTAKASTSAGCYHAATLEAVTGDLYDVILVNKRIKGKGPATGTVGLAKLADRTYVIKVSSGCAWSFSFAPD